MNAQAAGCSSTWWVAGGTFVLQGLHGLALLRVLIIRGRALPAVAATCQHRCSLLAVHPLRTAQALSSAAT